MWFHTWYGEVIKFRYAVKVTWHACACSKPYLQFILFYSNMCGQLDCFVICWKDRILWIGFITKWNHLCGGELIIETMKELYQHYESIKRLNSMSLFFFFFPTYTTFFFLAIFFVSIFAYNKHLWLLY